VVLEGPQEGAVLDRDGIFEDLLIGEEPSSHEHIEDWRVIQGRKRVLTETAVVHRWLLIRVRHSDSLTHVVEDDACESNHEKKGHAWAKQERQVDQIDDKGEAIMGIEKRS